MILASNSPRRRQLLGLTDLEFRVVPADVDETPLIDEPADEYVRRLAAKKAHAAAINADRDSLVIAADTTVVDGNQILGKPVDDEDAGRMLLQLRGRNHQVFTAVAVLKNGELLVECCKTEVPMRAYSLAEMQVYIQSGDPLDKAGAYAIQHKEFHPVDNLQGCYANVVGLPLCHLVRLLRKMNVELIADVPQACQMNFDYKCPIYGAVLQGNYENP